MKVTLNKLCKARDYTPFQVLKLKKELIGHQKSGKLFFEVNIMALDMDTEFELYFSVVPNKETVKNAFPVPLDYFQVHKNERERYNYLKGFYETYYNDKEFVETDFQDYDLQKPYVGNEYVWYFKRTAIFS